MDGEEEGIEKQHTHGTAIQQAEAGISFLRVYVELCEMGGGVTFAANASANSNVEEGGLTTGEWLCLPYAWLFGDDVINDFRVY